MNAPGDTSSRLVFGLPEPAIDFLIALGLNVIFVALVALLLWPLGKIVLAARLTKGYAVFWIVTLITAIVLFQIQRLVRVSPETRVSTYVVSNLGHGMFLLAGWSAFAAVSIHAVTAGAAAGITTVLWVVGIISSVIAFVVVTTFHRGVIYRLGNILVALVSFTVFAIWPGAAQALYGWFFDRF